MKPGRARAGHRSVAFAAFVSCLAAPVAAQAPARESDVKAAYLPKFAPFVEWPAPAFASPQAPLTICVQGKDNLGAALDTAVRGQKLGDRAMSVRRLSKVDARSDCRILYIGGSREQGVAEALAAVAHAPILSVTDEAAGKTRGIVHFVVQDRRVRFHIDVKAADGAGLKLSAKLLDLALSVKP